MKHFISLPAVNKQVSIATYCTAIRIAKANPTQTFKHGLTTWWPTTGQDILRQFMHGLHDRINNRPVI